MKFRKKFWGLETVAPLPGLPPAPSRRQEERQLRPGENPAYSGSPFGPFPSSPGDAATIDPIARSTATVDIRGAADWRQILRVETGAFQWGQLVISAEASAATPTQFETESGITWIEPENFPHVEIRVLVTIGGVVQIWFEGAAGNQSASGIGGEEKSAGPIHLPFLLGEVPDTIEVYARARRGGLPETAVADTEVLTVTAATRFKR